MLDRSKLMRGLFDGAASFFDSVGYERDDAHRLWLTVGSDPDFAAKAWAEQPCKFLIPSWQGLLAEVTDIKPLDEYEIVGIDGSQIYPDRHQGIGCFLVNVGVVHLNYGQTVSTVTFDSTPSISFGGDSDFEATPEAVNALRTQYELESGLAWMGKRQSTAPGLFLFDGSLIFWHLPVPESPDQNAFLLKYLALLESFFSRQYLIAGYISLPKNRELINLLRIASRGEGEEKVLGYLLDIDIAQTYLAPGKRSALFRNHSPITQYYPEHSKPYFFYLNTGDEIARIEIPAWVAMNTERLDAVASMVYDQAFKGQGYPISLAEAHEQAVVTHGDRDFFYQMLHAVAFKHNRNFEPSQKSSRKRRMNV